MDGTRTGKHTLGYVDVFTHPPIYGWDAHVETYAGIFVTPTNMPWMYGGRARRNVRWIGSIHSHKAHVETYAG